MSYTPIEGGLPQNLLDEFRSISLAFARLKEDLRREIDGIEIDFPAVVLPPFPRVEDSNAFQDLNREIKDLEEIARQQELRLEELLDDMNRRIYNLLQGILTEEQLAILIANQTNKNFTFVDAVIEHNKNITDTALAAIAGTLADVDLQIQAIEAQLVDFTGIEPFDANKNYLTGDIVSYLGGLYVAKSDLVAPSPLPTDTLYWDYVGQFTSVGGALAAHSAQLQTHQTWIDTNDGVITAHGQSISQLESAVNDPLTGLSAKASIAYVDQTKADIFGATVLSFTQIDARFTSTDTNIGTRATVTELNNAKAEIYGAAVTAFTQINAEFNSVDATIATKATITYVDQTEADILGAAVTSFTNINARFTSTDATIASKANITYVDQTKADIYGSAVLSFTLINAEFTNVNNSLASKASISYVDQTEADIYGAAVSSFTNINSALYNPVTGLAVTKADITYVDQTEVDIYGASVATFTNINARFTSTDNTVATKAAITYVDQTKADIYGAAVTTFTNINAALYDPITGLANTKANITYVDQTEADIYGAAVATFTNINAKFTATDNTIATKAAITYVDQTEADILGAAVSTFTNINARFTTTDTAIATKAAITYVDSAVADEASARASTFALLGAENVGGTAFILNQSTVQVTTGTSWASWEATLQASINGKATITQWQEVRDDTDSVLAKAGLQLNVNNHITGWALNNNGATGDMVIQVDKFFIVTPPGGPGGPTQVFAADASGVYIDTAYIRDLTVDVLTAGTINVPIDLTGSITIPNTGYIRSGQTAWNVGTGWWMGHEGGVPKFSLGAPTGQRLTWSAATGLQITGAITLTSPIPYSTDTITGLGALATRGSVDLATADVINKSLANVDSTASTKLAGITAGADPTAVTISNASGGLAITGGGINLSTNTSAIRSGQTAYNTGTGWWLGRDPTNGPRFSIGNGTTQYMRWTGGATPALETNRLVVNGSIISNSPLDTNAARIHTGGGRTAPFVIYDITSTVNGIIGPFWGPSNSTGHNFRRLAFQNQDALIQVSAKVAQTSNGEEIYTTSFVLEYRTGGGNWINIATLGSLSTLYQSNDPVSESYVIRFTTPNTWSTLDFRVNATNTAPITRVITSVFFNNANKADPVNATTSGGGTTTPLPPGDWTVPPGTIIP